MRKILGEELRRRKLARPCLEPTRLRPCLPGLINVLCLPDFGNNPVSLKIKVLFSFFVFLTRPAKPVNFYGLRCLVLKIGFGPPTIESKKRKNDKSVAFFATFFQGHQLFGPPRTSLVLRPWSPGSLISRTGPRWIFTQCRSDRVRDGQNTKKPKKYLF